MKLLITLLVTTCLLLPLAVSSCAPILEDRLAVPVTESRIAETAMAVKPVESHVTILATEVMAGIVVEATTTPIQTPAPATTVLSTSTPGLTVEPSLFLTESVATVDAIPTATPQLTDDASESTTNAIGHILYSKLVDDSDDVIFMEDIQHLQTTKTHDPTSLATGIHARYSHEADKIVFASSRDGNLNIYTMSLEGNDLVQITNNAGIDSDPVWSPSGSQFAYIAETGYGDIQIFVYDIELAVSTQLTTYDGSVFQPSWSPDGSSIVFAARPAGEEGTDIYLLDLATNDVVQLTNITYGVARFPRWSPDGQTVAYLSDYAIEVDLIDGYEVEGYEVHLLRPSTSESVRLTRVEDIQGIFGPPVWSPDGKYLLVVSLTEAAVYIVDVETGRIAELVDTYLAVSDWFILDS